MDSNLDLITLLSLLVAVVAVWKLRNALGRDDGGDERRANRSIVPRRPSALSDADVGKVVTVPRRDPSGADVVGDVAVADGEQRILTFAAGDRKIGQGLIDIYKYDSVFDPNAFLKESRQAYELIVTAFAEANRKTLKDLLSREVYDEFVLEMVARDKRGELIDQSFVGINKADIVEANVKSGVAFITVRFVSQLITATRDRTGTVTGGDPQKIREVTDVWTFNRDVSTPRARQSLNWKLVATQEA